MHAEELVERYRAGERDFRGIDLRREELRGAVLSGADLGGVHLEYADLRGAVLSQSDLSKANLRCADLRGASFWCASLLGADLSKAIVDKATVFVRADLTDAVLAGTHLYPERLKGAVMPDGSPHRRSANLAFFSRGTPQLPEDCPVLPKTQPRVRLWLPTLEGVHSLAWPPYCVCCGEPSDRLTEWSGAFDMPESNRVVRRSVDLKLPYCTACLQHDARSSDIPGPFLWEEMGLVGWVAFSLLWTHVGVEAGARIMVLLSGLSILGSLAWLVSKAIRHRREVGNAKATVVDWLGPTCVPPQSRPAVFLGEITNLLGSGPRTYVLSFANADYAMQFAEANGLRVLL